jgi:hypothetical protein
MKAPLRNDPPLVLFGLTIVLLVVVSAPATYGVISQFHGSGSWFGVFLSVALLVALEVSAVGCKLSVALVPQWRWWLNSLTVVLLLLTTVANYAVGYDYFITATDPGPTLTAWKAAGYAPLLAWIFAGLVPTLLFVFLTLFTERVKTLQQAQPISDDPVRILAQQQEAFLEALQQKSLPAPPQEALSEALYECDCGALFRTSLEKARHVRNDCPIAKRGRNGQHATEETV